MNYWLKFQRVFWDDVRMKKLRRTKDGSKYTCILLDLMLAALPNDGDLRYSEAVPYEVDDLTLFTTEPLEIVAEAVEAMRKYDLVEVLPDGTFFFPDVLRMTGKESDSAERVRRHRERKRNARQVPDESRTSPENVPDDCYNVTDDCYNVTQSKNKSKNKIKSKSESKIIPRTAGEHAPNIEPKTDGLWSEDQLLKFIIQNSIQYGVTSASETSAAIWQKYGANGWKKADGTQITNCEQYVRGILKNAKGE